MNRAENIQKVAFLSDYIPRNCGIATFTSDLRNSIASQYPRTETIVISVNDIQDGYDYPPEVRFEISEQDIMSYRRAADFINFSHSDVVSLQHEFGIFGGSAGSHLLALLRDVKMPVVTTLHTVLREPNPYQLRVMKELIRYSTRLVVMNETAKKFLKEIYKVGEEKIDLIPHGIPDMPFVDPNFYKDQFGVEGKYVLLTFGLLSPNKGIENVLKALPEILKKYPNVVYIVLGATHPNLIKSQGESYRMSLERLANDLGIRKNVIFYNRFVEIEELKEFLGAADIYITPYLNEAQITSGTLAYAFGCGKAVISTPYWHAEELLADGRGILVPFKNPHAIAEQVILLLENETLRHAMRKKAYLIGREMVWNNIAHQYIDSFLKARELRLRPVKNPLQIRTLDEQSQNLPQIKLDHLIRMTDTIGIFQHARYSLPHFEDGYCLDDNARALMLTVLLENTSADSETIRLLMNRYASFVNYSFDRKTNRFRNFMSFNRNWIEKEGSEDSHGRALWALGISIGISGYNQIQNWAAEIFSSAIIPITEFTSPRAWAFSLLGIYEYCKRLSGDRTVNSIREELEKKLIQLYNSSSDDNWLWFEKYLTYCNAHLPHALISASQVTQNEEVLNIGLKSLEWLCKVQKSKLGNFNPIGNNGFYKNGGNRAMYDQQPVEAFATVAACLKAYQVTDNIFWLNEARLAFEWFLGRNDTGIPLYEPDTGGCKDGLHIDRANLNMGAESTLAYLLSLTLMHLNENTLNSFEQRQTTETKKEILIDETI